MVVKKGSLGKAKTLQLAIAILVALVFSTVAIMLTLQLINQVAQQSQKQVIQATQSTKEIEKKYKDLQQKLLNLKQIATTQTQVPEETALNPANGFRAFTIPIDIVSGVSGALKPDTRVDVFYTGTTENGHQSIARTLLQNIRILYLGTYESSHGGSTKGKTLNPGTATLEVTPLQSALLALSIQSGKVHLALRGREDNQILKLPVISQSFLAREKSSPVRKVTVPPTMPDLPPPPAKPSFTMEIFKGASSETQTFETGGQS